MLLKISLLLICLAWQAPVYPSISGALPVGFFQSLNSSIDRLKLYQTKVSEDLLNISLELDQTLAVYEIIDLIDPEENKDAIKQELVDQIKELRRRCSELTISLQKAHRDIFFKNEILNKREQDYQNAVAQATLRPLPEKLKAVSAKLKSKFTELAEVLFDKDFTRQVQKKIVQQKQFQDEIMALKTQQQTLLKCLGSCKKSFFISKKNAELMAQIATLETFVKKIESERKTFFNKYGATSVESALSILNNKQVALQTTIAELTEIKKIEYSKFIQIDFQPLDNNQNITFYSAKKCIENYSLVLEDILYISSRCIIQK